MNSSCVSHSLQRGLVLPGAEAQAGAPQMQRACVWSTTSSSEKGRSGRVRHKAWPRVTGPGRGCASKLAAKTVLPPPEACESAPMWCASSTSHTSCRSSRGGWLLPISRRKPHLLAIWSCHTCASEHEAVTACRLNSRALDSNSCRAASQQQRSFVQLQPRATDGKVCNYRSSKACCKQGKEQEQYWGVKAFQAVRYKAVHACKWLSTARETCRHTGTCLTAQSLATPADGAFI